MNVHFVETWHQVHDLKLMYIHKASSRLAEQTKTQLDTEDRDSRWHQEVVEMLSFMSLLA